MPTDNRPTASYAFLTGLYLLLIPLYCLLGADIAFVVGSGIGPVIFPLAVVAASTTVYVLAQAHRDKALLSGFILTIAAVWLATLLDDMSSDGIIYHQEIIVHLLDGWNPFTTPVAGSPDPDLELLVAHYAKGVEIMASTVASFTGRIESGKAINILMIVGTGLIACFILVSRLGFSRGRLGAMLAMLVALNPVGMSQVLTYYNDFYSYYLILITLAVFLVSPDRFSVRQALALGAVIIVAASVKFTAFFYVGMTVFGAMILYFATRRGRLAMAVGLTALAWALLAVCATSYHPYVTNTLIAGHPCYPLMGEGAIDIMTGHTPEVCIRHNRFVNFLISILTPTRPAVAPTLGGFGPLCAPMLVYSLIVVGVGVWRKRIGAAWLYAVLLTLGCCFIFEQSWWARYIPFLWLMPVSGAIISLRMQGIWRRCGIILTWMGILTGAVYLASSVFLSVQLTVARHEALALVGSGPARIDSELQYDAEGGIASRGVLSTTRHIHETGIETSVADPSEADAGKAVTICLTGYHIYPGGVRLYLDPAMANRIRHEFTETWKAKILRLHNYVEVGNSEL